MPRREIKGGVGEVVSPGDDRGFWFQFFLQYSIDLVSSRVLYALLVLFCGTPPTVLRVMQNECYFATLRDNLNYHHVFLFRGHMRLLLR